jgi:hypothetical protein
MEMKRRGFLGILAGAVLGKVVGPKLTAEPIAPAWEAAVGVAPELVTREASYVPLEVMSNRILERVREELKWLKLRHHLVDFDSTICNDSPNRFMYAYRMGDDFYIREAQQFTPFDELSIPRPDHLTCDWIRRVPLREACYADVRLDIDELRHSRWNKFNECLLEPVGFTLAEHIIRRIRHNGGADHLVCLTPRMDHLAGVARSLIATAPDACLGLRATQFENRIRFEIQYGIG